MRTVNYFIFLLTFHFQYATHEFAALKLEI
jgi:hypothetical protein